jgi:hypothetical protein
VPALSRLKRELGVVQELNLQVQSLLRSWSQVQRAVTAPRMLDQAALPWFAELNRSLVDKLDDHAFDERIRNNTTLLARLAAEISERARGSVSASAVVGLRNLLDELTSPDAAREPLLFRPAA